MDNLINLYNDYIISFDEMKSKAKEIGFDVQETTNKQSYTFENINKVT